MSNSKYIYTDKHTLYHIFSKTPVRDNQGLGEVVNKSGHTVLAKQLFVDEIPWFPKFVLSGVFSNKITQNAKLGVDYVVITDKFTTVTDEATGQELFTTNVYKRKKDAKYPESGKITTADGTQIDITNLVNVLVHSAAFISEFWEPVNLHDGYQVKNADGQRVLVYHKDVTLSYLDGNNNANQSSNKTAARAFNDDGKAYELFVSGMEAIHHSLPSAGLNPVVQVYKSATDTTRVALDELLYTDEDLATKTPAGYFANNFNGTIFFNADYSSLSPRISFFQYVGRTLDKKIVEVDELEQRVSALEEGGGTGGGADEDTVKGIVDKAIVVATLSDEGGIADVEEESENANKLVTALQVKTYVTGAISEIEIPEIPEQITYDGSGKETYDDIIVTVADPTDTTDTTKKIISAKFSDKTNTLLTSFAKASDLAALQTKVGSIEGNITDIQGNITDIQATIYGSIGENPATGLIGDIDALQETVGSIEENVTNILTTIGTSEDTDDTTLHGRINTLTTNFGDYYTKDEVYTKDEIDDKILTGNESITANSEKLVRAKDVTSYVDGITLGEGEDIADGIDKLVRAEDVVKYVTDITSGDITISVGTKDADGTTTQSSTGILFAGSSPENGDIEVTVTKDDNKDGVANLTIGATLKTSFATAKDFNELSQKVHGISALSFKKLDELPEPPTAEHLGSIYLIPDANATEKGTHDQYICIESEVDGVKTYSWELIGNTDIDLSEITLKSINGITGDYTDKNLTIKYNDKYHGSSMIDTGEDNNTITFNPAQGWEYNGDSFADVVKVENGVCYDATNNVIYIIDDGNLTKGQHTSEDQSVQGMFESVSSLESFIGDLSTLTDGSNMFMNATSLKTFIGDLGKMKNGTNMFMNCGELESVNTDLSSLEYGTGMFSGCKLTKNSIEIICDMLPTVTKNEHADNIYTIDIKGNEESDTQGTKTYVNNTASAKNWKIIFNDITYPLPPSEQ